MPRQAHTPEFQGPSEGARPRPVGTLDPSTELSADLSAGELCLDFVNTLGDRPQGDSEKLNRPVDVLAWCQAAGLIDAAKAAELAERLMDEPRLGDSLLEHSIELRERLYGLFHAVAAGEPPPTEELPSLSREIAQALTQAELVVDDAGGFAWSWRGREQQLENLHWPIVRSAAALLTSEDLARVCECGGRRCSWLFVDRSRGRRRRWCDMKICGNREKARRHYRRHRSGDSAD